MNARHPAVTVPSIAAVVGVAINLSGLDLPPPEPAPPAMAQFASADLSALFVVALSTFAIGFAVARM